MAASWVERGRVPTEHAQTKKEILKGCAWNILPLKNQVSSEQGANYRERARRLHIWKVNRNSCSGFGRRASETPGGMRSAGKKKKNGFDLVDQTGTVGNRPKMEWRTVSRFLTVPVTWLLFYGGKWDQLRNRLKGMMDRW